MDSSSSLWGPEILPSCGRCYPPALAVLSLPNVQCGPGGQISWVLDASLDDICPFTTRPHPWGLNGLNGIRILGQDTPLGAG